MNLFFLRHCQSIYNKYLTSSKNCELTEEGKLHASTLSGNYDMIICSTLKRAVQTLQLSSINSNIVEYTERCREFKTTIGDFFEDEEQIPETEEEFKTRVEEFEIYLKRFSSFNTILVVCHGDFIFEITGKKKYPENGEIIGKK